jgi:hypothetical protein
MIKIVKPDLDDLEFMGGSYELNQSNVNYFEKKLDRRFDLKKYVYDFEKILIVNLKTLVLMAQLSVFY